MSGQREQMGLGRILAVEYDQNKLYGQLKDLKRKEEKKDLGTSPGSRSRPTSAGSWGKSCPFAALQALGRS